MLKIHFKGTVELKDRASLKRDAKAAFKAQWGISIALSFVGLLLMGGSAGGTSASSSSEAATDFVFSGFDPVFLYALFGALFFASMLGLAISIFLAPIQVGLCDAFLNISLRNQADFGMLFTGFTGGRYGRNVGAILWWRLWSFLWALVPIYGWFVKPFEYALTPYVLADHPEYNYAEALNESKRLTKGFKLDLFVLYLSFFGWLLLSALTFGILAVVYVGPYMQTSLAAMYLEIKQAQGSSL
jgi:uncharacterized membrane protein